MEGGRSFARLRPPGALVESIPARPVVKKIAVLSVNSPEKLYTENKNLLTGIVYPGWIESVNNWQNTKDFNAKMDKTRLEMGGKMTASLAEALSKEGFQVEVIAGPKGPPDDPENVDYKKLATDGVILHLWFDTVGMYAGRTSSDYIPRVNVRAYLLHANDEEYLYNESLYYGADARGEDYWSIPANPDYKFPNFPAMVEKASEVAEGYDVAMREIAKHVGKEFRKQFRYADKTS
jgi:hypothetical protein